MQSPRCAIFGGSESSQLQDLDVALGRRAREPYRQTSSLIRGSAPSTDRPTD